MPNTLIWYNFFAALNYDCCQLVFKYLPINERIKMTRINKYFNEIFWKDARTATYYLASGCTGVLNKFSLSLVLQDWSKANKLVEKTLDKLLDEHATNAESVRFIKDDALLVEKRRNIQHLGYLYDTLAFHSTVHPRVCRQRVLFLQHKILHVVMNNPLIPKYATEKVNEKYPLGYWACMQYEEGDDSSE